MQPRVAGIFSRGTLGGGEFVLFFSDNYLLESATMEVNKKYPSTYDFCQYKNCRNCRYGKNGCHLYYFPQRGTQQHDQWLQKCGKDFLF